MGERGEGVRCERTWDGYVGELDCDNATFGSKNQLIWRKDSTAAPCAATWRLSFRFCGVGIVEK